MLYNHSQLIGRWENIKNEDGKLLADPVFMEDDEEKEALKVQKRVEAGFVKGASLGIRILSAVTGEDGIPVVEAEVMECSIVDIPSNANSITLYNSDGEKLTGDNLDFALSAITKKSNKLDKTMKLSAEAYKAIGLSHGASDEEINKAIQTLSSENVALKAKIEAANKAKIEALLSAAIKDGRIKAAQKEKFEKLAAQDFDLAKETIEGLPKAEKLAGKEDKTGKNGGEDRSKWTFSDWRKKDTAGLLSIKKEDPDRYAEIIKS